MTRSFRAGFVTLLFAVLCVAGISFGESAAGRDPSGGRPERSRAEIPATLPFMHGPTLPASAVYPAQEIPLRFRHDRHLALGMQCDECHRGIRESTRARELNLPTGATCDRCHGKQHPRPVDEPARCNVCHTRVEDGRVTAAVKMPAPLLEFDHRLHLGRGIGCVRCHGDMSKVRLATTLQLPREASCLECHDGFEASARCATCHLATPSGKLVLRARDDRVSPPLVPRGANGWGMTHDLAFVEDHAAVAKTNPDGCATCHDEIFCQDCHNGAVRPMRIHAGDYLTLHAMDARAATMDCQSCHRTQSFCLGCHERLGFGDRTTGPFGVGGGSRFHPEGWSGPPGVPQAHAFSAQSNMGACTSCHDEDSCLACHATTDVARPGLDVSPHGRAFATSARCQNLASRNHRACLKCHPPGARELDCLP